MSKNILLTLLFVLVFLTGFGTAKKWSERSGTLSNTANDSATPAAPMADVLVPQQAGGIRQLLGAIVSIEGDTLLVSAPGASSDLNEKVVSLAKETRITEMVLKDSVAFQAELAEYQYKAQNAGYRPAPGDQPPQMMEQKNTDRSALKVGQKLRVTAGEDIGGKKAFTATTIEILTNPVEQAPESVPPTQ